MEKGYLSEPLSKLHQGWESIKIRCVLFARDEIKSEWFVEVLETEYKQRNNPKTKPTPNKENEELIDIDRIVRKEFVKRIE